jgi:DNA-binding CsgD family transcriptional regulator
LRAPAHNGIALASCARMDEGNFARFLAPDSARWLDGATRACRSGTAIVSSRLVSDRDFERTDFYNDVVRPAGGFYGLAVCHQLPALSSFVTVCRRRQVDDFDAADETVLQMVAPHLATALRIHERLANADRGAAAADPEDQRRARKDAWMRRYALTSAEADVALEILRGDGRKAVAARLGIAETTARTHLSRIFWKTGARRQAELVRLLLQEEQP